MRHRTQFNVENTLKSSNHLEQRVHTMQQSFGRSPRKRQDSIFCHQAWGEGYTRGEGYREHTCNLTAPQTGMQRRSGSLGLLLPLALCIQYIPTCRSTPWRRGERHGVSKLPYFNVHPGCHFFRENGGQFWPSNSQDNACKAEMENMHNNVEIIQREGQFVYFTMWEHRGHAFQRKDEQIGRARSMPSG